jgi:hypothetical protein
VKVCRINCFVSESLIMFHLFRYHFEQRNILANINISYILVTGNSSILKHQNKFKGKDVSLDD